MNRMRTVLLGLGFLLAVSAAQAQQNGVKANIPFNFVVGSQVLPAGEYLVTTQGASNHIILIRSSDSKAVALSLSMACSTGRPSDTSKLVFHTLGGQYFLSQIWAQGYDQGRQLPRSKAEVEMAKNHTPTGEFVLAAKLTR